MPDLVGAASPLRTFGLRSLCRHWRLLGICGAGFLIIGLLFIIFKPASYTSSTQLLVYVREVQPGPEPIISPGAADLTEVQNEIEIIRSPGMLAKVVRSLSLADDEEFVPRSTLFRTLTGAALYAPNGTIETSLMKLGFAAESLEKHLKVQRVGTSHTILVSVSTSNPNKSERIANAIGRVAVQTSLGAEQEGSSSPLQRERLQGLGPNAYVITAAGMPERPDGPRKVFIIPAAAIFGVAIGAALALLLDFKNRTIRTATQVEHFGMECIGAIPQRQCRGTRRANRSVSDQVSPEEGEFLPHAMLAQTLRRVAVAVESSKARVIGVASAAAGEGATTVAQCLAQLEVRSQKKVLLVDASRIEPAHITDHARRTRGGIVPDELTGLDLLKASREDLDGVGGIPAWGIPDDQNCFGAYDVIVVDLPPLERGPEFRMAAQNLDGILLVLKWGSTTLEQVEKAIAVSGVGPSEFIGAVLNVVDERMIGKFGDKLWEAEARLVARRPPLRLRCLAR